MQIQRLKKQLSAVLRGVVLNLLFILLVRASPYRVSGQEKKSIEPTGAGCDKQPFLHPVGHLSARLGITFCFKGQGGDYKREFISQKLTGSHEHILNDRLINCITVVCRFLSLK